jgi:hypothetical protein
VGVWIAPGLVLGARCEELAREGPESFFAAAELALLTAQCAGAESVEPLLAGCRKETALVPAGTGRLPPADPGFASAGRSRHGREGE